MNKGLKSYAVCDLLGVTRQTLRYWKSNLDPINNRSDFDGSTILAYRIIDVCINKQGINARKLQEAGTEVIFRECNKHRSVLQKRLFVFNNKKNKIVFMNKDDIEINLLSMDYRVFALEEIVDEHVESMISMGSRPSVKKINAQTQGVGNGS